MIDAFASLCTDLSETLLANFIIYCEEPQPELVMRLFSHIPEFSKPPHQVILKSLDILLVQPSMKIIKILFSPLFDAFQQVKFDFK